MQQDINDIIDIIYRRGNDEVFMEDLCKEINQRFPPCANARFDSALECFVYSLRNLI